MTDNSEHCGLIDQDDPAFRRTPFAKRKKPAMGYKARITLPTEDELPADASLRLREYVRNEGPNDQPKDDTQPGDIEPKLATAMGVNVTRVRQVGEFKIARRNPFGFWYIIGLEKLGTFTSLSDAKKSLHAYLKEQQKKEDA